MYRFKRGHDLFDDCLDTRGKKQQFQPKHRWYLDEPERRDKLTQIRTGDRRGPQWNPIADDKLDKLYRAYRRRERDIRHISTRDMALFLHGRSHFAAHVRPPAGASQPVWRLHDLNNTLLNTSVDIALPVPDTTPARALRHPTCKVRNLGELGLLVRDKRLPSLLCYYPQPETAIDQAEIRAELASYRRVRVQIMELIHVLEPAIQAAAGHEVPAALPPADGAILGAGRHGKLLRQLRDIWRADTADTAVDAFADHAFRRALELRNAIAHNAYPATAYFPEIVSAIAAEAIPDNPSAPRHIAKKLLAAMIDLYRPWLDFLGCALPVGLTHD
jgi:hypothetical protein